MFMIKNKLSNLKSKNYVWKKNDFLIFFDDYSVYNNYIYIKNKNNVLFQYLGDKHDHYFKYNLNYLPIYKTYRKYCLLKK